jgi:molybdate transport system substrate-binding protein
LISDLARENLVTTGSISDIGRVETALAVRDTDPLVSARDAASLREALLEADAIFVPDTKASTAGIHVAKVLRQLGVAEDVSERLKIYPNGATPCGISPKARQRGRSAARNRPRSSIPKA